MILTNPILIFSLLGFAFLAGYLVQFLSSKKKLHHLQLELQGMHKKQNQMRQEHSILLEAMEGAKAQAEEFQRKLYGTNIMEISEPEDAEHIFNRQILAEFIFKQMNQASAQSDGDLELEKPGDAKVMQSLSSLDEKVVKILADVVK